MNVHISAQKTAFPGCMGATDTFSKWNIQVMGKTEDFHKHYKDIKGMLSMLAFVKIDES